MTEIKTASFTRRHLPHWRVLDKPYFVTFRLKNTIPENVVMELHAERIKLEKAKANQEEIAFGSLKQHVSHDANKILGTNGRMWCDENYDHWCRTPESVKKFIEYIKNNPVKAGLVNDWRDWKWTKVNRASKREQKN